MTVELIPLGTPCPKWCRADHDTEDRHPGDRIDPLHRGVPFDLSMPPDNERRWVQPALIRDAGETRIWICEGLELTLGRRTAARGPLARPHRPGTPRGGRGMTATLDAPLASEVILIRLPGIPEARPRWVEFVDVDDIEADGTGAIFWHRVVETSAGDLMVSQWLWISPEGVTVTRAFWDSRGYEFELTGRECVAMADALRRVARYVEQADRDALTLAGDMGDPWITTTEAAKRLGTTGRELQDLIAAGVTAVKIASVTYVRAADLPGVAR